MKPEKNKEEEQDFLSLLAEKGGFAPIKHNHKEIDVIDLDRIRWKCKFIKGQEYKVNDLVSYQGNLYICMTDNKGQAPTTNFWELLTVINDKDSIRKGDAISLLKNDKNYITELMFMSSPLSKFRNDIGFITKEDIDWQSNVPSNEKDPIFLKHPAYTITRLDIDSWNNGLAKLRNIKIDFIGGGGGGSGGGVTTETDPIFTASPAHGIDAFDIANWNTAYGWGNHAGLYELTGTASGFIGTHESTYDHTLIATALQSLDGAWLDTTNQIDLTGDKSGSFDLTTTGTGTFYHIVETTPTLLRLDQTTDPQVITATDVTITATDEIYFGDVTDSTKIKKDTVQGILDLVPAPDLSAYVSKTDSRTVAIGNDLYAQYLVNPVIRIPMPDLDYGYTITNVKVQCWEASPATQFAGDLKWCDAWTTGAFPSTNPTVIKVMDTTTGNYDSGAITEDVATGKELYVQMDSNVDYGVMWTITITYTLKTS